MPHQRHKPKAKEISSKSSRKDSSGEQPHKHGESAGSGVEGQQGAVGGEGAADAENRDPQVSNIECCLPTGCECKDEPINVNEPGDAVKVVCNNEQCTKSGWMHHYCFQLWEESVLSFLRSCGRARSWSEKQRLQNLWTKKGYDLAYKACDCSCSRGHLRKDLDYFPKPNPVVNKKKHNKKNNPLPTLTVSSKGHHSPVMANNSQNGSNNNHASQPRERVSSFSAVQQRDRVNSCGSQTNGISNGTQKEVPPSRDRSSSFGSHNHCPRPMVAIPASQRNRHCSTASMTSTGSSPPNSTDSPSSSSPGTPCTPVFGQSAGARPKSSSKFDFFPDAKMVITGNMFQKRESLHAFGCLPPHMRNPYHIKMEDDGPHGNDDTRNFLMENLSAYKATQVNCLLCRSSMHIFDRYPLIDGTFFLSPLSYDEIVSFPVEFEEKKMYLHAVCIYCLQGAVRLFCQTCERNWNGSTLVLGTMYSYDIFAANACCEKRYACKKCSAPVKSIYSSLNYFSEYSRKIQCPRCKTEDYHFVKPLQDMYHAHQSICN